MRRSLLAVAVTVIGVAAALSPAAAAAPTPSPTATPKPTAPATSPGASPVPTDALSQALADALAQQAAVDAAKASLQAEVDSATQEKSQLAALVQVNRTTIQATEQGLARAQADVDDATRRAAAAHAAADAAHAAEVTDRRLYEVTLRQRYEQGDDYMLTFLVTSTSFSDLVDRIHQATELAGSLDRLAARLRQDTDTALAEAAEATRQEQRAAAAAAALQTQEQTLTTQVADEQSLIDRLGAQAGSALATISTLDGKTAALAQQIAELRIAELDKTIADAEQAAWDEAQYYVQQHLTGMPAALNFPGSTSSADLAAQLTSARGALPAGMLGGHTPLIWPAPGTVIAQGFGPSPYPFEPPAFGVPHFHTGIDLAGPMGTPIYAPADGVIASATPGTTGYGNHVVLALDHNAMCLFGHLEAMLVKAGDTVKQGQLIALMGSTGNSTGPHLHFEVRVANIPIDPTPLLPALPAGAAGPPALPH